MKSFTVQWMKLWKPTSSSSSLLLQQRISTSLKAMLSLIGIFLFISILEPPQEDFHCWVVLVSTRRITTDVGHISSLLEILHTDRVKLVWVFLQRSFPTCIQHLLVATWQSCRNPWGAPSLLWWCTRCAWNETQPCVGGLPSTGVCVCLWAVAWF